ncbi:MAG: cysteine dioxygenase family protein [Vicinamibacteria bacterium]
MSKTRSVEDFVSVLKGFTAETMTSETVLDFCRDTDIQDSSLVPYVHFQDAMYTRNLIYRDDLFEVMAICWKKGQKTPLHSHNGQLGWMIVSRGIAEVSNFKWQGCNASEGQHASEGLDCIAGATELSLSREHVETCTRGGHVNSINREKTIHQVAVVGDEPVVSVHVYSRPIDSCVAFDLATPRCYRRSLRYFSEFGDVMMTPAEVASLTLGVVALRPGSIPLLKPIPLLKQ